MKSIWDDASGISVYTRAQALEDGVLVDAAVLAKEAGILVPVALTDAAWGTAVRVSSRDHELGQDETGRLWDVLSVARVAMRGVAESFVRFSVSVAHDGKQKVHELKAIIGPGDAGEPVITVMLPHED